MNASRIGGVLLVAGSMVAGAGGLGVTTGWTLALALIATGFIVVGYARPRALSGRWARSGAVLFAFGLVGFAISEATSTRFLDNIGPIFLSFLVVVLGFVLVVWKLVRTRGLPRVVGLLLVAGLPIALLSSSASGSTGVSVGIAVFLIGVAGLGILVAGFDPSLGGAPDGETPDASSVLIHSNRPSGPVLAIRWTAATAAVVIGVILIARPYAPCDPGRSCVYNAGISLAIPARWGQRAAGGNDLFVAALKNDPAGPEVFVELAQRDLPASSAASTTPSTLDDLEHAAVDAAHGTINSGSVLDSRVILPIGPAARLAYSWTFFDEFASIEHWFFVNGQPVVFKYIAYPPAAATNPPDLDAFLGSIKPLDPSVGTWIWVSTAFGLALTLAGVVGVGVLPIDLRRSRHGQGKHDAPHVGHAPGAP